MTVSSALMKRRFTRTFLIIAILLPVILALALPVFAQDEPQAPAPDRPSTVCIEKVSASVSKNQQSEPVIAQSSSSAIK